MLVLSSANHGWLPTLKREFVLTEQKFVIGSILPFLGESIKGMLKIYKNANFA